MFRSFCHDRKCLNLTELEHVVQFASMLQGLQRSISPEPVIWEAQQWFIGSGWQAAWSKQFTDEFGAAVVDPRDMGQVLGWEIEVDLGLTDPEGWRYARSLPKDTEGYLTTQYSTKKEGCYGRWRRWQNRGEDRLVRSAGSDTLTCDQFGQAVRDALPGLHAALCVLR